MNIEDKPNLLICPDCGHVVSIHANYCPLCGATIASKALIIIMKTMMLKTYSKKHLEVNK